MTALLPSRWRHAAMLLLVAPLTAPISACAKADSQTATPPGQSASTGDATGGGLTLAQFQQRQERRFLAADTDGDGRVSKAEFLANAKAGKGDPAKRFARLDSNGDGMLDKSEIDAMLAHRFQRMDTDGDGLLTAQERVAARPGKGAGKGAQNGGPADASTD